MQFSALLALLPLALAAPAAQSAPAASPELYYLKTTVTSGNANKNNLYVDAYHTGAGTNDPTLSTTSTNAAKGFLNGTNYQFNLGNGEPYSWQYENDINYAIWDSLVINGGAPSNVKWGYNSTYGLYSTDSEFDGFLACDWNHGFPQLFYLAKFYQRGSYVFPDTCSKVKLFQVPA